MTLFSNFEIRRRLLALKEYFNGTDSRVDLISSLAQLQFKNYEIDVILRILILVAALASIYSSYRKKRMADEKEDADKNVQSLLLLEASRIAGQNDTHSSSRLELMESKVKSMAKNLSYLLNLCPQMNDRRLSFGTSTSMWSIPSIGHGDFVLLEYNLLDILDGSIIKSCHSQYLHLSVSGFVGTPTEILVPMGTRIVVTKATRIPKGIRDMENSIDLTNYARTALESSLMRVYR